MIEPSPQLPTASSNRDWASPFLQAAHRISSLALILLIAAIASHVKKLAWPPILPTALLLAGLGLGIGLIGCLAAYAQHASMREAAGVIFFSLFLITAIIMVRVTAGVPLLPLRLIPGFAG
jgi:hypothetical protein